MARNYRHISADSHYESPPEHWTHRVAKQYRDRAPEAFDPTVLDFDNTPGCGSAEQRLREQDQDGIDAEVLFALDVRNAAIRDKAAFLAVIKGFNDYLAEEYCAVDRDRLIGVAVLPNTGAEEDVAELERCKRMGLKGAWLST